MKNVNHTQTQEINGIKVCGAKKERPELQNGEHSSVNFTGSSKDNIGKIAVYLYYDECQGRIFDPGDGDLSRRFHAERILAEDEDSFIVLVEDPFTPEEENRTGAYVMKYPELYSLFRIVDTTEEADAILALLENYAYNIWTDIGEKYPFDIDLLDELGAAPSYDGSVSEAEQQIVLDKLRKTEFGCWGE